MLTLRCVKKTRAFLSPLASSDSTTSATLSIFFYSTDATSSAVAPNLHSSSLAHAPSSAVHPGVIQFRAEDVVFSFREWFKSRGNPLFDRIFEILSAPGDTHLDELTRREIADSALSRLNLRLTEALVLQVLGYGKDVLSCLKFFDWAGRQPGFFHTRATIHAIFKILSKAKLMSLMFDFLDTFSQNRCLQKVRFGSILVMGYAVAGKPEVALHLFGKMRFQGVDLDRFTYHVLLNALVEEGCCDDVETVARQIRMQGFESEVTHSILVKFYCKQNQLDQAEEYFRGLIANGIEFKRSHIVCSLVDGYCKSQRFDKAWRLVEEFGESYVYDVWVRELVRARKLDGALEFLQRNNHMAQSGRFVPNVFRYNSLIWGLLRENRLEEICDVLIEMKENDIVPDEVTLNCVLCFFCKAGMADVALHLFESKGEFGLSPSSMAYNYLINTLCGDGSVDDAYRVLRNSVDQGYFPRRKTFAILVDALCRSDKLDTVKELFVVALERKFVPSDWICDRFISALCRNRRVEDGYIIHELLSRFNKVTGKSAYFSLINSFSRTNRGDIASRLLMEMHEKGYRPTWRLCRTVIQSVCGMENPEKQFFWLMGSEIFRGQQSWRVSNLFIDGAGRGMKPALAREVYDMMTRNGILHTVDSDILMLKSYLKCDRISDALHFFGGLASTRYIGRRLWNTMIVGLCKNNRPDLALAVFSELRRTAVRPSLQSYEDLVKLLCEHRRYDTVINLISDCVGVRRYFSSFMGNILLFHSLKTRQLYHALQSARSQHDETSWIWTIGELINVFSDDRREFQDVEQLDEIVEKCFPLDLYTYNMLLTKLSREKMDDACKLFYKLCRKGYMPNKWTYNILVHGFYRHGRTTEAITWTKEMYRLGFDPDANNLLWT